MRAKIIYALAQTFKVYLYEQNFEVSAIAKGIFKHDSQEYKPMVGDEVIIEKIDDQYVIVEILNRKNQLIRPRVCNIDVLLVVTSVIEPDLNTLALNKYLAFYESRNISNVIIGVTKIDLLNDKTKINEIIQGYKLDGYQVYDLNDINDLQKLIKFIDNKTLCLAGNSGVGKSTLINRLDPSVNQRTQAISKFLNRGKHTTTATKIIRFLNGFLVDTPGFGSLEVNLTKQEMASSFNDFANYARLCKFSNCLHINEPDCNVIKAVENKKIQRFRYNDYLSIIKDLPVQNLAKKQRK